MTRAHTATQAPGNWAALTSPDPATGHVAGGMTPDERAKARKAQL